MDRFFVPTGEVIYLGTDTDLANVLYGLRGEMGKNGEFRCWVSVPQCRRENGISLGTSVRTRMSFLFCGHISPVAEGYKISYKVRPTVWSMPFLFVPIYLFVQSLIVQDDLNLRQFVVSLAACGAIGALLLGLYLLLRHFAVRQFVKIVEEEDSAGIFN